MPFSEVMELALYHPQLGFYSSGGQAGRRSDFITSPEVGPLFGHVVANAIDAEWDRLGRPELLTVVDVGAGPGTLARAVLAAQPQCGDALRYIAVEQSVEQRAQHPESILSLDVLSAEVIGDGIAGVVIANELLDNLAFTPMRRVDEVPAAAMVIDHEGVLGTTFVANTTAYVPNSSCDAWVDQAEAVGFVLWILDRVLQRGRLIAIDYARQRSDDVEIRTYAEHGRAGDPLEQLGTKDITVDVDLEQLQARTREADSISSQATWLDKYGIHALVDEGRQIWNESAAIGDLSALKARSRIREAEALTASDGLGGFLVAEWIVQ